MAGRRFGANNARSILINTPALARFSGAGKRQIASSIFVLFCVSSSAFQALGMLCMVAQVQLTAASTQAEKATCDTAKKWSAEETLLVMALIALFLWWLFKKRR